MRCLVRASLLVPALACLAVSGSTSQTFGERIRSEQASQSAKAEAFAARHALAMRDTLPDGRVIEFQMIDNGIPLFFSTSNLDAATATKTDTLWSAPYGLTGSGYEKLGIWDESGVRLTHQELVGRVIQMDMADSLSNHATHVAGTLVASGTVAQARGMAPDAALQAFDWNHDLGEMYEASGSGMELSNHSYLYLTGWDGNDWFGDVTISQNEAYGFGYYGSTVAAIDELAYQRPYYLIVKAVGNERDDTAPPPGTAHTHNRIGTYYDTHYSDHFDDGYDTIPWRGNAKNILTVGAIEDLPVYMSPADVIMSRFSSWGPTDDGRIKPDIVGNGVRVYSSLASGDSAYASWNGTSMASPNVTGTLALLRQLYQSTHAGARMRSSTLKALLLHTAKEAGDGDGPDYRFGWGGTRCPTGCRDDRTRSLGEYHRRADLGSSKVLPAEDSVDRRGVATASGHDRLD
jgi:trimeric autotransporter adhesin